MNKTQLEKKLSQLECFNHQLVSELKDLDQLLKTVGFAEGLKSAKAVAQELLEQDSKD